MIVFTAYPPDNILAIVEGREQWVPLPKGNAQELIVCRFIDIHLLNLLDGSPYFMPPSNVIQWGFPPGVGSVTIGSLEITSSRVVVFIYSCEAGGGAWGHFFGIGKLGSW